MSDLLHWWLECEPDGRITLRGIRYVQDEAGEEEELSIDNSCAFTVDVARSAQACFDNGITLFDEDTQPLAVVEGGEEIKCCHFEPDLCLGLDIMPYFLGWNELFDAVLNTDPTRKQRVLQRAAAQSMTHVAAEQLREKIEQRKQEAEAEAVRQAEEDGLDQQDETRGANCQSASSRGDHGVRSRADQSANPFGDATLSWIVLGVVLVVFALNPASRPALGAITIVGGMYWLAFADKQIGQATRKQSSDGLGASQGAHRPKANAAADAADASRRHARLRQCQTDLNDAAIRQRAATAAGHYRGADVSGEAPEGPETLFSDDEDN